MTGFLSSIASSLYGGIIKARNAGYDRGLLKNTKVESVAIISTGGLSSGGSGKTPMALYIAERLRDMNLQTAIVLRGYKGTLESKGAIISAGQGPLTGSLAAGDEAYLLARRAEGITVLVGAAREDSVKKAIEQGCRAIVLDDGFQHRQLKRDVDLLLVSPEDLNPATKLLPAGPLREPAASSDRADVIVGLSFEWLGYEQTPEVLVDYIPTAIVDSQGSQFDLSKLDGSSVFALTGIAKPERFLHTLASCNINVAGHQAFLDHHVFDQTDLQNVMKNARAHKADAVVTTEKDLFRQPIEQQPLPVFALSIDVSVQKGAKILDNYLNHLAAIARGKRHSVPPPPIES